MRTSRAALLTATTFALAGLLSLPAPAEAQRHRQERASHQRVVHLARQLDGAAEHVRAELHAERRDFDRRANRGWRDRGWDRRNDSRLDRAAERFRAHASRFRQVVERRGADDRQARPELERLLESFYDADREIRRAYVSGHLIQDFEQARWAMDSLIESYGGYRQFRHVRPGHAGYQGRSHGRGHDRAHDDRRRGVRHRDRQDIRPH